MRIHHLATKCNYYARLLNRNIVGVRGAFEESLWFFSQYCIGSLWGETCCSVIDGKLQLKHASAAKKSDMNKNKRYVGWGCILNCFMLSSLPCFYAFCWSAIPTSCYIFNVFYSFTHRTVVNDSYMSHMVVLLPYRRPSTTIDGLILSP